MTSSWIYKYPPPASEQPEALRLAEVSPYLEGGERGQWIMDAAAELRRLHQLALDQQGEIYALNMARSMEQKTAALKAEELERCKATCAATSEAWREDAEQMADAHLKQGLTIAELFEQRDALLEALKVVLDDLMYKDHQRVIDVARAAIAAAEGEKT